MTITTHHATAARRIGVLVFMGVAAALVGVGTSGNAAAIPVPSPGPFVPGFPDNPRGSSTVNPVVRDWGKSPAPAVPDAPPPPGQDFGDSVSLNPQPLPPGPDRGSRVSLNPQPLPPGPDLWREVLRLPGF